MANLAMGATPLYFSSPYFRTLTFGSTATIPPEGTASKKTAPSVFKKDVLQQLKEIEQKNLKDPLQGCNLFLNMVLRLQQQRIDIAKSDDYKPNTWNKIWRDLDRLSLIRWKLIVAGLDSVQAADLFYIRGSQLPSGFLEPLQARVASSPRGRAIRLIQQPYATQMTSFIQEIERLSKLRDLPATKDERDAKTIFAMFGLGKCMAELIKANEQAEKYSHPYDMLWQDALKPLLSNANDVWTNVTTHVSSRSLKYLQKALEKESGIEKMPFFRDLQFDIESAKKQEDAFNEINKNCKF